MTTDRILPLAGVNNFRDFGGYAVAGGRRVRRGLLWRSGQHVTASDEDLEAIAALRLATVADLRGDSERALNPCRRHPDFTAEVLVCTGETAGLASHVDASTGVMDEAGARSAMCRLYAEMPYRPNLVNVLRQYFRALGHRDGASLIHCFAGKDRTGFAVALTHHTLGVHRDDAMQDYLLTNLATAGRGIPGSMGHDQRRYAMLSEGAMRALLGVAAEYLDAAFAAVCDSHGSVDDYLADMLGVDADLRESIRASLIED